MSQTLVTRLFWEPHWVFTSTPALPLGLDPGGIGLKAAYFPPAIILTALGAVLLGLVYFRFDPLVNWVNRWLKKKQKKITLPEDFKMSTLFRILVLSFLRYGIFIAQYFFAFFLWSLSP